MERKINEAEAALAADLSRVLAVGGHRAGALIVTREPLPGVDASTRCLSAVGMRDANLESAVDVLQLIKRLRTLAVELEITMGAPARPPVVSSALRETLAGREFYDLMQAYRHAAVTPQEMVSQRFRAVQSYLVGFVADAERERA